MLFDVFSSLLLFIALYEMIGYIIGNVIRLGNRMPCALLYECYVKAFICFDGDILCAIHCSGSPHGWPIEAAWLTSILPISGGA